MCTLTYIPFDKTHYIITSNRDESGLREKALAPAIYNLNGKEIVFPKDPAGGGSWIAASKDGVTACLLNGAFYPHFSTPPYRKSRGLILLEVFNYRSELAFCSEVDLEQIEPFTLVIFSYSKIIELKWTGKTRHIQFYSISMPHIWASEQLYSFEKIMKRNQWFSDFLLNEEINNENILQFHENAGEGDIENDMKMRRGNTVSTISITQVVVQKNLKTVFYKDLQFNEEKLLRFDHSN